MMKRSFNKSFGTKTHIRFDDNESGSVKPGPNESGDNQLSFSLFKFKKETQIDKIVLL